MLWGATGKSIGSENASAPFGSTIDAFPWNVSALAEPGTIVLTPAEPFVGYATVTAVMGSATGEKAFEMAMRIWDAPTDMCSVCRMVEFGKTRLVWFCVRVSCQRTKIENLAARILRKAAEGRSCTAGCSALSYAHGGVEHTSVS
jgi:hypothetical protein